MRILAESTLPARPQSTAEALNFENFAAQLNTTFQIHAEEGHSILVKLGQANLRPDPPLKPGQCPPGDAGNEKFSLFFRGRRSELLEQNTYRFQHEALGRFELFIVPVFTRNAAKIDYEAVINRPRDRRVEIRKPQEPE
jgi:hypothetical protein